MQISNANTYPIKDAIAGPPLIVMSPDAASGSFAAPTLSELAPATDLKGLEDQVKQANDTLKASGDGLQFAVKHDDAGASVQLTDGSGQVLQAFAPEHFMSVAGQLQNLAGIQVNLQG